MAFEDYKITSADLNGKGVIGLPDAPQLSAEAMQNKFEETARDVIIPRINTVLEKMDEVIPPFADVSELEDGQMYVYDGTEQKMIPVTAKMTFDSLDDVDMTGLANGMYPRYDYATRKWIPTSSTVSVPSLNDINDVNAPSPSDEDLLVRDGTNNVWKNGSVKLDKLSNVNIHLPQNKQVMAYNASADEWQNTDAEGGGHKIENASGAELTQRETLQFSGYLKTTDENLNERTVVDDSPETITWANWKTLTDEQKAGKKWLITNIPSADGVITIENMKCVWTNPNPSQAFPTTEADRAITLDTDDYDNILVIGSISGGLYDICTVARKGDSRIALTYANTSSGSYTTNGIRIINANSATSLYVNDAIKQNSNGTRTTDNSACIPLAIYIFKNTSSIHFSAIAHDVKATQDYSTIEHVVGTWIDGSLVYEKTIDMGTMPNATYKNVNHNVSNIGKVVYAGGTMIRSSDNVTKTLPFASTTDTNSVIVEVTNTVVYVSTAANYSTYNGYITIRYTKTS